jgi:hypothetical protein
MVAEAGMREAAEPSDRHDIERSFARTKEALLGNGIGGAPGCNRGVEVQAVHAMGDLWHG